MAAALAAAGASTFNGALNTAAQFYNISQNSNARKEAAYTANGLPSYLAYMQGGASGLPQTYQHYGGNNFARMGPTGSSFRGDGGLQSQYQGLYPSKKTPELTDPPPPYTVGNNSTATQTPPMSGLTGPPPTVNASTNTDAYPEFYTGETPRQPAWQQYTNMMDRLNAHRNA